MGPATALRQLRQGQTGGDIRVQGPGVQPEFPLQQRRSDVGAAGGQHRSDAVAAHGPQRPLHIAGGLVFDGKDGDELTVHRQKNAGLELQVTRQGHMVLFHEIGAAHGDRFPTDGTADAAVLVKTQVLQMQVGAALAGQQLVKQRRQLASGGLCRRGGIGHHLADLLAVQLQSVEAHRSRWEQVVIRHHHPPGGGDGGGPGITCHGAAAAVQTPVQR